ncbi:MAG: DUF3039 domain-containing protein [Acidothermaceae bacterium]
MSDIETVPGLGDGEGQTLTLPKTETPTPRLSNDGGDHERFAHYAPKDKIVEASVMGTPITALCGKVWVPSRDPSRFPVCPECKEIYDNHLTGDPPPSE